MSRLKTDLLILTIITTAVIVTILAVCISIPWNRPETPSWMRIVFTVVLIATVYLGAQGVAGFMIIICRRHGEYDQNNKSKHTNEYHRREADIPTPKDARRGNTGNPTDCHSLKPRGPQINGDIAKR